VIYKSLFVSILLLSLNAQGQSQHTQVLIIGGNMTFSAPPFAWDDACTGQLTGANRVVLTQAAKQIGKKLSFAPSIEAGPQTLPTMLNQLESGEIHFIKSLSNRVATEQLAFSKSPIVIVRKSIVTLKSSGIRPRSLETLKGLKGVYTDTFDSLQSRFKSLGINISNKKNSDETYQALLTGEADFIVAPFYRSIIDIAERDLSKKVTTIPNSELDEYLYLATLKGSEYEQYLPLFDKEIQLMRKSRYIRRLNAQYLQTWMDRKPCD